MVHYQVEFRAVFSSQPWTLVKTIDDTTTGVAVRVDPSERLTFDQAEARRVKLARRFDSLVFRVCQQNDQQ